MYTYMYTYMYVCTHKIISMYKSIFTLMLRIQKRDETECEMIFSHVRKKILDVYLPNLQRGLSLDRNAESIVCCLSGLGGSPLLCPSLLPPNSVYSFMT